MERQLGKTKVTIRKANVKDIEQVMELHREGFPDEIWCQVPRKYRERWWRHLLESDMAEVYVAEINNNVAGATVLVLDLPRFTNTRDRFKAPLVVRIFTILLNPRVAWNYLAKFLRSRGILNGYKSEIKFHPDIKGEFIYIDTTTVTKAYRRLGIHKIMRANSERRTLELNRKILCSTVDPRNRAAIFANLSFNSVCTAQLANNMLLFKKFIGT